MSIKNILENKKVKTVKCLSLRLRPEAYAIVKTLAKETGMPINTIVNDLIEVHKSEQEAELEAAERLRRY